MDEHCTLGEGGPHLLDRRGAVRQRLGDCRVAERRNVAGHLAHELGDQLGEGRFAAGRADVADPPAGHRVRLAHAVDRDDTVGDPRRSIVRDGG